MCCVGRLPTHQCRLNRRKRSTLHLDLMRSECTGFWGKHMRNLTLAAFAAAGLAVLSLPAAAVPAGPALGISSSSDMLINVRMRHHHMRRHHMRRGMMSQTQRRYPGASFVRNKTRGAAAGSSMGNGTTGSYAAPSGK
jgi:hypothetical protein